MKIHIHTPIALHQKGIRSKNEDNIYPRFGQATADNRVFLVCDGVGGAAKGELASEIVSKGFGQALEKQMASAENLAAILTTVQNQIDAYLRQNPESQGMATTLTLIQLHTRGVTIAHAGDSRVYHIRGNDILWRTQDHSLVNDLRKRGFIEQAEEAKNNVITRAIQGRATKPIELDVQVIADIQASDYFLLCSDGVWGVLSDEALGDILKKTTTNQEKLVEIEKVCAHSSKDNYSAYLIEVQRVEQSVQSAYPTSDTTIRISESDTTIIPLKTADVNDSPVMSAPKERVVKETPTRILVEDTQKSRHTKWVMPLLVFIVLSIGGGIAYTRWEEAENLDVPTVVPANSEDSPNTVLTNNAPSPKENKKKKKNSTPSVSEPKKDNEGSNKGGNDKKEEGINVSTNPKTRALPKKNQDSLSKNESQESEITKENAVDTTTHN
jgi:serine/threonine protein phosphatase PrpC